MPNYQKQSHPLRIPTTDGKLIEEHFGLAASSHHQFSLAHMVAPPGWSEPFQQPEFDEITIMVSGRKRVEIEGEEITLQAGESLLVKRGARVRYSNPFGEAAEYWSVCMPAFSPEGVRREEA
ncbi:MAG: cupin domain-containing protein [Calditrichaceae bacterium]|nr:cupin domain-containing protein [Calditrichia bacterium]NUQ40235.1 cupin domain-containing protein [Calditrichaceae bacterium]